MASAKPKVVVIGAGTGGLTAAQGLHGAADVTVVDRKDYFEIPYPRVRLPVEPAIGKKITIPLTGIPKLGQIVTAAVTGVSSHEVKLDTGAALPYDFLVLATGGEYPCSEFGAHTLTAAARRAEHQVMASELSAAGSVLIVGGGAVGLEVAAEIATTAPQKRVTLVHSGTALLPEQPPRLGRLVRAELDSLGVKVILGERAVQEGGAWRLQKAGNLLQADKVYICTGGRPNTSYLREGNADVLDTRGFVKVDQWLRVEGRPNWFAIGDITNLPDGRLGRLAHEQGTLIASNLRASVAGKAGKAKAWKRNGGLDVLILSLGKGQGACAFNGWSCTGFLPTKLKSRDLFAARMRGMLGLPK